MIQIGGDKCTGTRNDTGFWVVILDGFFGKKLNKEEADCVVRKIQEGIGWNDLVEEKSSFVEVPYETYEVLVYEKRTGGKAEGAGPSGRYHTRSGPNRGDDGLIDPQVKGKVKFLSSF